MPNPSSLNPLLIALLVERCWNCWNIINNSAKYYFKNLHAAIAAAAAAAAGTAAMPPNPKAKARTKHRATGTQCRVGVPKASRSQSYGAAAAVRGLRMWRQHGCEAFHTHTHTHALVTCILNNRRTTWGKERRMENRSKCRMRMRKRAGGSTSSSFLHCAAAVNLFRLRLCLPPGCVCALWVT